MVTRPAMSQGSGFSLPELGTLALGLAGYLSTGLLGNPRLDRLATTSGRETSLILNEQTLNRQMNRDIIS